MSTLPSKAKVVIIGGGIHGLSTAWKLSETYKNPGDIEIGRAHVRTPVTEKSRMPSSA